MINTDRYETFFKKLWYRGLREDITLANKAKLAQKIGMRKSEFLDFMVKVPEEGWAEEVAINSKVRYKKFFENLWSEIMGEDASVESKIEWARKIGMTEDEISEFFASTSL